MIYDLTGEGHYSLQILADACVSAELGDQIKVITANQQGLAEAALNRLGKTGVQVTSTEGAYFDRATELTEKF